MDEKAGLYASGNREESRRGEIWRVGEADSTVLRNQLHDKYAARKRGIVKDRTANGTGKVGFSPWSSTAIVERGSRTMTHSGSLSSDIR